MGCCNREFKDIGFNLKWVVNREVIFAFGAERQECINNVRTWGQHSREGEE